MRKIVGLAIALLLLALFAAPVSAQTLQVTIQGSGHVVFGADDAIFTVHIDTATDTVEMKAVFPGRVTTPDGQFVTGLYWQGEIKYYKVYGNIVTVNCLVTAYLLPWHEPFPGIGAYEVPVQGELTGPGKRGNIVVGDPNGEPGMDYMTMPGTIIIR